AIHHALVARVDRGEEEIDQPVVVYVAGHGHGVALLPAELDRRTLVLEAEFPRPRVAQELGAILPLRRVREVGDEEVEVRVVVKVGHTAADRMAAAANRRAVAVGHLRTWRARGA